MRPTSRLLIAASIGLAHAVAFAADDSAAAWQATQRVEAAQQALSERYTAIWATLDATQKARFGAQERAWLNGGREREQQACVARAERTELVKRMCTAEVVERHLGTLASPQRVATAI